MWANRFAKLVAVLLLAAVTLAQAASHTGVDTDTSQVLSNKELNGTNFFDAFRYVGKLTIGDIHSNTVSGTVAHRIEYCNSAAAGNITMTLPAAPALGDTYTLVNESTSFTCVLARAGSQTLNGATSLTLAAYVAPARQGEHCVYLATNDWYCEGSGT